MTTLSLARDCVAYVTWTEVAVDATSETGQVEWIVDGERATLRRSAVNRWEWPLSRGAHHVSARVAPEAPPIETRSVAFFVQ